jgi:hypothetical protein
MKNNSPNASAKILQAAEELFSEKGFNGASVNMIAQKANVNKALIYYYFKDKDDIILSLFQKISQEANEYIASLSSTTPLSAQDKIKSEFAFFSRRKKILSIMLMESLKGDANSTHIFKIAENMIDDESMNGGERSPKKNHLTKEHYHLYEFFTGFMPIITFIVFQEKWCNYYHCDSDTALEYFLDSFYKTHWQAYNN